MPSRAPSVLTAPGWKVWRSGTESWTVVAAPEGNECLIMAVTEAQRVSVPVPDHHRHSHPMRTFQPGAGTVVLAPLP
jgi:hypothetical protein